MSGDLGLIEDDVLFRLDARREIGRCHLARVVAQLFGVLPNRDGMQIDHAVNALVVVLQIHEIADRTQIVAQMQIAGGLHARKDARHDGFNHSLEVKV